ncbi:MAG: response regulator [Kiritimatiellae bacterium]|nr:response regulator [Kiritimatiellia bacterium]
MTEPKEIIPSAQDPERLKGQQEMAGALAHDLNNLLMPIIFQVDLLLMNSAILDDKNEIISGLKNIRGAAENAQQITTELQEVYLRNRHDKNISPLSLKKLLQQILSSYSCTENTPTTETTTVNNSQKDQKEAEKQITTHRNLRILAIDDEKRICLLLEKYFSYQGHHIETAANGTDGIKKFQNSPFDIVITDLAMPDIDGNRVAQIIKETSHDTPVILMTGLSNIIDNQEKQTEYLDDIIQKPLEVDKLMGIVNAAIDSCANKT